MTTDAKLRKECARKKRDGWAEISIDIDTVLSLLDRIEEQSRLIKHMTGDMTALRAGWEGLRVALSAAEKDHADAVETILAADAKIDSQSKRIAELEALLRRCLCQFARWQEKYGRYDPHWLPPAGDVTLFENISEAL